MFYKPDKTKYFASMRTPLVKLILSIVLFIPVISFAGNTMPSNFTYQGRLMNAAGTAALSANLTVYFEVRSPSGACLLYSEHQTVDTTLTSGLFTVNVGSGTRTSGVAGYADDPNYQFAQIFTNKSPFPTVAGSCAGGYIPGATDARVLRIHVYDGTTTTTLADQTLSPVPQASVADTIDGVPLAGLTLNWTTATRPANPVANATHGYNQTLTRFEMWNGFAWVPTTPKFSAAVVGDTAADNDVLKWNNITKIWEPAAVGTLLGNPGGDVSGNYTSMTVEKIQGQAIATTAPNSGEVLKWNGTEWEAAPDAGGIVSIAVAPGNNNKLSKYTTAGTQLTNSSISDDGTTVTFSTPVDMGTSKITNVANPVAQQDAVTINYLEQFVNPGTANNQILQWDNTALEWKAAALPASVSGSGTQNKVPKFNNVAGTALGDSSISDSGALVTIANPTAVTGSLSVDGPLVLKEIAAPTNTAGYGKIYVKADNNVYYMDEAGTESQFVFGSGAGEVNTASNLGTGVGIWKDKSGVDLRFKSLTSGPAGTIDVVADAGGNEIDIDLAQNGAVAGQVMKWSGTAWAPAYNSILTENDSNTAAVSVDANGSVSLTSGAAINEFSTDGTMLGNSDAAVPTEKAVKTYVDAVNATNITDVTGGDGVTATEIAGVVDIDADVDNSTVELSAADGTGKIRIKDSGITVGKLADNAVETNKIKDKNVTFGKLADGVSNGDILKWNGAAWALATDAGLTAIVGSPLTNGKVWIGDGSNAAQEVALSQDVTITNAGVATVDGLKGHALPGLTADGQSYFWDQVGTQWKATDVTGLADGYVMKWDNTLKKWYPAADAGAAGTVASLEGATGAVDLQNGATGTAPNWAQAGANVTLHIPLASGAGVTSGTITKTEYDAFTAKQDALTAGTTTSQYLKWDGDSWEPAVVSALVSPDGLTNPVVSVNNAGKLTFPIGSAINEFSTDGGMTDNSDAAVPTEKAVKTYVDAVNATNITDVTGGDGVTATETAGVIDIDADVDNSTVELSAADGTGKIRVKDAGITNAKLAADSVQTTNIKDKNVTFGKLADGVSNGDILKWNGAAWVLATDAGLTAIVGSPLTNGKVWVGDGSNAAQEVALSGDATITNAGVVTVSKIQNQPVNPAAPATKGQLLQWNAAGTEYVLSDGTAAPTDGQVLSWDNALGKWKPAAAAVGDITDVVAGAGLTGGAASGSATVDVNVDGSTLEIAADTVQVKDAGITNAKLAADSVQTTNIKDKNVTLGKLADGTSNGQMMFWNATAAAWQYATMTGLADGKILKWDATLNAGNGGWKISDDAGASGTVASLKGATGTLDLLNTVTSGTDAGPTWSVAGSNITLNIPLANNAATTTGGLLTKAQYDALNAKQAAITDGTATSQYLKWDGDSWEPAVVSALVSPDGLTNPVVSVNNAGKLTFPIGSAINEFSTDGGMTDNSDAAVPTEKAVKTYADAVVAALSEVQDGTANGQLLKWNSVSSAWEPMTLTGGQFLVGNGAAPSVATAISMSGDATMSNAGAVTIANDAVTTVKILDSNVTTSKIADANVTLAKLAAGGTKGQVMQWSGTAWQLSNAVAPGAGEVLTWDTALNAGNGGWKAAAIPASGDITDVVAGAGLTGGAASGSATVDVNVDGSTLEIAADTVQVKDSGITNAKLAVDSVQTTNIKDKNVTFGKLADGVSNGDILKWNGAAWALATDAGLTAIVGSPLTNGKVWVGDGSNAAQEVALSQDVTITNAGVATVGGLKGKALPAVTADGQSYYWDQTGTQWKATDVTGLADGFVMKWDNTLKKWYPAADAGAAGVVASVEGATGAIDLQNGATGTAPNWAQAGANVTLHIPLASGAGVTSGTISKTDYDAFTAKQDALTAGTTASQYLKWDGDSWEPAVVSALVSPDGLTNPVVSVNNAGKLTFPIGSAINEFSTDGGMTDNSDAAVPTEKAVKTYVDTVNATNITDVTGGDGITATELAGVIDIDADVDGSTLELSAADGTGKIRVKDGGITDAKIATVSVDKIANGATKYLDYRPNNTACADNEMMKWDNTNHRWICSGVLAGSIGDITDVVAGAGLTGGAASGSATVDVNVDGSTLEIATDTVQVKDAGITNAKLAVDSVQTTNIKDKNVTFGKLADGASNGQILKWNGAAWALATDAGLTAIVGSTLTNGKVWVGDGSNAAQEVALSQDITITNAGVATVGGLKGKALPAVTADGQSYYWDQTGTQWKATDVTGLADGFVMKWDNTLKKWYPAADAGASGTVASIEGATGAVDLQNGSTGTAPNWTQSGANVTLHIPLASGAGVTSGTITKAEYDRIPAVGTVTGQTLRWSGTAWAPVYNSLLTENDSGTTAVSVDATGNVSLTSGAAINEFSTDGGMTGNSDAAVPTEKAVKTYVDAVNATNITDVTGGDGITATELAGVIDIDADVDNSTLELSAADGTGKIRVKDGGITDAKIATVSVDKIANGATKYLDYRPNNTACADNEMMKWDNTNRRWICSGVLSTSIGDITDVVAGAGLTGGAASGSATVDVNVDGSTIEINADTVRVKALGIDSAQLAANAVTTAKITDANVTLAKLAAATTAGQVMMWDGTANAWVLSKNTAPNDTEVLTWDATLNSGHGGWKAAALPASGESNTASNYGVGGVGLYNDKNGVDLRFKNINAGSNKVTVTNDAANREVDIDINPANIPVSNTVALTDNKVWIGDGTNIAQERTISQDMTMTNTGVATVGGLKGHALPAMTADGQSYFWDQAGTQWKATDVTGLADGYVMKWDNTLKKWYPAADAGASGTVASIEGATGAVDLQNGATGTAPNWTQSGANVTLHIPLASGAGVTSGTITKAEYDRIPASGTINRAAVYSGANSITSSSILQDDGTNITALGTAKFLTTTLGSNTNAAFSIVGDPNTGMYSSGADVLDFTAGSTNILSLTSTLIDAKSHVIANVSNPTANGDAVNRAYVDAAANGTTEVTAGSANGQVIRWNSVSSAWEPVTLASAQFLLGNGAAPSVATAVSMSGDVTMATTGATTIGANKVVTGMINDGAVTLAKLNDACAANEVIQRNAGDTAWVCGTPASGTMTGIISAGGTSDTATVSLGAPGTAGNSPNWTFTNGTPDVQTINIPMASGGTVTAGLISNGDYLKIPTTVGANGQVLRSNGTNWVATTLASGEFLVGNGASPSVATAVTMSGDVTMTTAGATTVGKIQGQPVAATAPATKGQLLQWNAAGTSYILSDGTTAPTDGQVLTWDNTAGKWKPATAAGGMGGSGTAGYIPKFSAGTTLANSSIQDDGTNVLIDNPPVMKDAQIYMTINGVDTLFIHATDTDTPSSTTTFVGRNTPTANTGDNNTGVGYNALAANTSGSSNVAMGAYTLQTNSTGSSNTGIGYSVLISSTGSQNTAFGSQALNANTTGSDNVAVGYQALVSNTTGIWNVAVGEKALNSNKAKRGATAIGYQSMYYADDTTTGASTYNTAVGANSLKGSSTAASNTGLRNTAVGDSSFFGMSSGSNNAGLGVNAGYAITTGSNNVVIGGGTSTTNAALSQLTTGGNNTAIGYGAGAKADTTSASNIFLGYNAGPATGPAAISNKLYINNSQSDTPLILGDFSTPTISINGDLEVKSGNSFKVYDSDNTNKVSIKTPVTGSLTADYTLTLPVDDGTASQVLTTDGAGVLSWTSPSGSGTVSSGTANMVARYNAANTTVSASSILQDDGTNVTALGTAKFLVTGLGSNTNAAFSIAGDPNTGMYSSGADVLDFTAGSTNILSLTSTIIDAKSHKISNVANPAANGDAVNRAYVDAAANGISEVTDGTATGQLLRWDAPTTAWKVATIGSGQFLVGTGTTDIAAAVSMSGDVTMTSAGATTVGKIQGQPVAATAPATKGQLLQWNAAGTSYILSDGTTAPTDGQVLTWDNTAGKWKPANATGSMGGSGTAGYIPKFSAGTTLANSSIQDDGTYAIFNNPVVHKTAKLYMTNNAVDSLFLHTTDADTAPSTNMFVGFTSGNLTVTGAGNTSLGYNTLTAETTGYNNVALGMYALASNTIGYQNNAQGVSALFKNIDGFSNVANGTNALYNNTSGSSNTAMGRNSMLNLATGNRNSALGASTGDKLNGASTGNVLIGYNAGPATGPAAYSNKLYIHNDETDTPLIYGDFVTSPFVSINGDFNVKSGKSFKIYDSDNTNSVTIKTLATGSLTADYALTLPADDGTASQVLTTDGAGVLSWTTPTSAPVTSVEGATGAIDLITTVTSGTNAGPTWSQAGSNVTLNIPLASDAATTTGGLITKAIYDRIPASGTSTGQITRWNGTSWVPTTATYPNTTAINTLLYSSAADTVSALATANTGALVTSNTGVPSYASGTTANRLLRTNGTTVSFAQADLTTDVTGVLPIANGGTGSSSQNFVDLTAAQTVAGIKTWSSNAVFSGRMVTGVSADTDVTVSFASSNTIRTTAAGACGTLAVSGTAGGGSFNLTMPSITATCTLPATIDGLTVKSPSGYTSGTTVTGVVYTFINDGTNVWVSSVNF